jgi:2,4-dienoyl-CoA reductase-like NADH-dependent reductase (Old Yellow Enzyme family)
MNDLFSELDVAGRRLANRLVLPPMATEQAQEDGVPSNATPAHYAALAATGVALAVIEHSCVSLEGRSGPRQISLADDRSVPAYAAIVSAVHAGGALCAGQISHAGSNRREGMPGRCLGPSAVVNPASHLTPEEMSASDIHETVRAFGAAADRVRRAGCDFVEIHAAHGYLLSQFLSPLTNLRTDAYGGTPERRRRLLLEVFEEVRGVLHADLGIMVRLGVADNPPGMQMYAGGLTVEEGVTVARALADAGVDILDLSAGLCGSRPPEVTGEAYYRPFAEAVAASVHAHTICTGGITQPQTAQSIIESGTSDLVGVGRALAADHDWVRKARQVLAH